MSKAKPYVVQVGADDRGGPRFAPAGALGWIADVSDESIAKEFARALSDDNRSKVFFVYRGKEFVGEYYWGYLVGNRTLDELRSYGRR